MDYDCGCLKMGIDGVDGQVHEGLVWAGVARTRNFPQSVMPVCY